MSKRTVELSVATPGTDAQGNPLRVPIPASPADVDPELGGEHLLINLGPQHPAFVFQLASQGRLVGGFGDSGYQQIDSDQRDGQDGHHGGDQLQEDFRGHALFPG